MLSASLQDWQSAEKVTDWQSTAGEASGIVPPAGRRGMVVAGRGPQPGVHPRGSGRDWGRARPRDHFQLGHPHEEVGGGVRSAQNWSRARPMYRSLRQPPIVLVPPKISSTRLRMRWLMA